MRRLDEILRRREGEGPSLDATATSSAASDEEEEVCPICRGAGFVRRNLPLGHPDFGEAFPCRCVQEEGEQERLARLQRYSNLGPLTRVTFEGLEASANQRLAPALATARQFADDPHGWLVLCGPSGSGKTRLAAAVTNRCIERGRPALFMVVPDLLDHLRVAYAPNAELTYDALFQQVRDAALLVLDELGAQSPTPWAQEKLFQLINHRYIHQLPTVFTLATPLDALEDRLRTRLGDATLARALILEGGTTVTAAEGMALPLLRNMRFETFNLATSGVSPEVAQSLRNAYRVAKSYAQEPSGWLVLLGRTGCGKTHLATAIGHVWEERERTVEFCVVPDLLDKLRSAYREDRTASQADRGFERVRTAPYLILDDLGVHSATPWAQEKLFQVLNHRYNAKLPTVITIGCPLDQLPEAWVSRMYDPEVSRIFEIEAPDYRGLPRRSGVQEQRRQGQRRSGAA